MNRASQIVLTVLLLLASRNALAAQVPATIEGVVLDAVTSEPLAGVKVTLSVPTVPAAPFVAPITPPTTATDPQGRFSLQTNETGRFRLVPAKDGYVYSRPGQTKPAEPGAWVQVSPGQRIENLELRMVRPAVISGRLVDSEGKVVGPGGEVSLMQYSYGTDGTRSLSYVPGITYPGIGGSRQRTNDQGEFRLYDVPPGEYYLGVYAGNALGSNVRYFYFPGGVEEAKASPIRVIGGEDLRLGTLATPPRVRGTEVTLKFPNFEESNPPRIYIGDSMLVFARFMNPRELTLSLVPGRYDLVVASDNFRSDFRYGRVTLDVGSAKLHADVTLVPGITLTGKVILQTASGERTTAPSSIRCTLRSKHGSSSCLGAPAAPGFYELNIQTLPADAYVLSAKAGGRDILSRGLDITADTDVEVVLATPGAVAQGTVRAASGETIPGATVALVPDAPNRGVGLLYRSVITDPNGKFEIHGIGPGSYKLFAWPELEGAAYRNADFMTEFEERGKPVRIESTARQTIDLTALELAR